MFLQLVHWSAWSTGAPAASCRASSMVHWSAGGILQGFLTSAANVVDGGHTGHVGEVELEADLRRI